MKGLYFTLTEKMPLPYQDILVVTTTGEAYNAYKSAWGNFFRDVDTKKIIDNVVMWRYNLSKDVIELNNQ